MADRSMYGWLWTPIPGSPSGSAPHSHRRTTENALRFLRRLRGRCLGDPVILTDRGPWYRDSVIRAGFQNHVHQTFGLRSSVERFFGYLKDRTRVFYNNINPKKALFTPLVDFLELFMHWYTEWR